MQISDQTLLKTQAYVNGQWIDADSGATLAVTNPATGETVASIA
jgi:succinate-semialdehyde dehydrogenase/glutarate-semialdehyde dehydrogenase